MSNIAAVDGIFHVLRTFEDPDITHVEDRVDPVDDMAIIHGELRAKDIERVNKVIDVCDSHLRASILDKLGNCVVQQHSFSVLCCTLRVLCQLYALGEKRVLVELCRV